jgi:hypothetical protein
MSWLLPRFAPGLLGAGLLLCGGAPYKALAGEPDPMAGFYGNTVTIYVPAVAYAARRYIDPDGTWREPNDSGDVRGVWKIENGQVCSWQTEPKLTDPRHYCYPVVARKVGDRWVTRDPDTGNEVVQAIEKGRD